MANVVYTHFLSEVGKNNVDLETAVMRVLLVRDTTAYTPNKDHDFLDDFTGGGGVEISVASYARQSLGSKAVNTDNTNDRVEFDFADVSFGALESGQTVEGYLVYVQVGGDDSTPANDILVAYIDVGTNLPLTLNGGTVTITINAEGFLQFAQA